MHNYWKDRERMDKVAIALVVVEIVCRWVLFVAWLTMLAAWKEISISNLTLGQVVLLVTLPAMFLQKPAGLQK